VLICAAIPLACEVSTENEFYLSLLFFHGFDGLHCQGQSFEVIQRSVWILRVLLNKKVAAKSASLLLIFAFKSFQWNFQDGTATLTNDADAYNVIEGKNLLVFHDGSLSCVWNIKAAGWLIQCLPCCSRSDTATTRAAAVRRAEY
jgi:hypothetical protein